MDSYKINLNDNCFFLQILMYSSKGHEKKILGGIISALVTLVRHFTIDQCSIIIHLCKRNLLKIQNVYDIQHMILLSQ